MAASRKVFLFPVILICFGISACVSMRTVYQENIPLKTKISGEVGFAGCQLTSPAAAWGTAYTSYSVPFRYPELLLLEFPEIFGERILSSVYFIEPDKSAMKAHYEGLKKKSQSSPYFSSIGSIEVFEKQIETDDRYLGALDPACLTYLNENVGKDFYLSVHGEIRECRIPDGIFNRMLMLVPSIGITVYDKSGKKVFSKRYSKRYDSIAEDYMLVKTYYTYLIQCAKDSAESMQEDLSFLRSLPQQGLSLEKFIATLASKSGTATTPDSNPPDKQFWTKKR